MNSNGAPVFSGDHLHEEHLNRMSPTNGASDTFVPLHIEGSSAPVPAHLSSPVGRTPSGARLGRATSSKKWMWVAVAATVVTLALGVGLGVGLSGGSDSDASTSGAPAAAPPAPPPEEDVRPRMLLVNASGQSLDGSEWEPCQALANEDYWEVLGAQQYAADLDLSNPTLYQYPRAAEPGLPFDGSVSIDLAVRDSGIQGGPACLLLNARNLDVTAVTLRGGDAAGDAPAAAGGARRLAQAAPAATQQLCGQGSGRGCEVVVARDLQRREEGASAPGSTADLDLIAIQLGRGLAPGSRATVTISYRGYVGAFSRGDIGLHQSAPFVVPLDSVSAPQARAAGQDQPLEALVVSQGSQTGARRILPCYDAPARKAVFQLSVQAPADDGIQVLSNTDAQPSKEGGVRSFDFPPTPRMSPYLLALAAGRLVQFEQEATDGPVGAAGRGGLDPSVLQDIQGAGTGRRLQQGAAGGAGAAADPAAAAAAAVQAVVAANAAAAKAATPNFRYWSVPGVAQELALARAVVPAAYQFYLEYLSPPLEASRALNGTTVLRVLGLDGSVAALAQPPELGVFDIVAVPGKDGAMENWGLLMFDEKRLLFDQEWEGSYGMVQAVNVICHEMAHQWFGNWATMEDWTQVSVNEGIPSYIEYECMQGVAAAIASATADPKIQMAGLGNVLFARNSNPQLEYPGKHESPGQMALWLAPDPTQMPIVPENDLTLGTGGYMQYAKPAAVLHMYERYLSQLVNTDTVLPLILRVFFQQNQGGTTSWPQFFRAASAVVGTNTQLIKNATVAALASGKFDGNATQKAEAEATVVSLTKQIEVFELRIGGLMRADSYEEAMAVVDQAYASNGEQPTIATWFYMPVYPLSVPTATPALPTDYNQTTFNIGNTTRPVCLFPVDQQLLDAAGVSSQQLEQDADLDRTVFEAQRVCPIPAGHRFFPLTMALGELTNCSKPIVMPPSWPRLSQTPYWTDSSQGAKLYRTVYDKPNFDAKVAAVASMDAICPPGQALPAPGQCCASQDAVLEAFSLLTDAFELIRFNNPTAEEQGLNAVTYLQALQTVAAGGAPRDAQWLYLIGGAMSESLYQLRRVTELVQSGGELVSKECQFNYLQFQRSLLGPLIDFQAASWLDAPELPKASPLEALAGSRLLWQAGSISGEVASQLCDLAPRSPLFQRWIYPNSSTLGGSFRFPPDLADGVLPQLPVDSPSADLLPAVYSMASGLPTYNMPGLGTSNCTATLLEASGQRGSGDPVADMRAVALQVQAGLQLCTMYEASVAEAQRCLFAMSMAASLALPPNSPPLSVQLLPTDVLPFLFRLGGSNPTDVPLPGLEAATSEADYPAWAQARFLRRRVMIARLLPSVVANIARPTQPSFAAILSFLNDNWDDTAEVLPGMEPGKRQALLCGVLDLLPQPTSVDNMRRLEELVAGAAKDCPAVVKLRVLGKAQQWQAFVNKEAANICSHVKAFNSQQPAP